MAPSGNAVAGPHDALITKHAAAHGVPESLVRRVIFIESKGNPRVISKGNYGLMQIRLGTAKSMGYRGTAEGLLDADTNMTYAVKYLALAYRAAGCSESGAIAYYPRGFYKKPRSKCAVPRSATAQVAKVETAPRQGAQRAIVSDSEMASSAPAEVLKPRVVQVQTITRPKPAPQPAAAQPPAVAPVQVAAAPVTATAPAPAVTTSAPAVQPAAPQAALPPQTVAKAPEQDMPSDSQMSPAIPTVFMELLPMPKPRPATAPKTVAKLEAAVASDSLPQSDVPAAAPAVQVAKLDDAAVPLPQPRPALDAAPAEEVKSVHRKSSRHTRVTRKRAEPQQNGLVAFFKNLTTPQQPARRRR
jgi:hypothetical protein